LERLRKTLMRLPGIWPEYEPDLPIHKSKPLPPPEASIQIWRFRNRWEDSIKIDLKETGHYYLYSIQLVHISVTWLTVLNAVINLGVPEKALDFLTILKTINFSRRILLSLVNCI
jgi:hypothetical protein